MEKKNFGYSLKNIPIPNKDSFIKSLISKTYDFIKRMRWKAHFLDQPDASSEPRKETYGFNSEKTPPQCQELVPFENDLYRLIKSLEFRDQPRNRFQHKLQRDVKEIERSPDLYVPADKTNNIYRVTRAKYNKLLSDNITASYKKSTDDVKHDIDLEAKGIACRLEIADRAESFANRNAFITLKDHKENFPNTIKCRLLNPAKSDIGRISKQMLEEINASVRTSLEVCQWRNTDAVVKWFEGIRNKADHRFIQFDVVDFYPSISLQLLENSISFAAQHVAISSETTDIIMHARKSLLFDGENTWIKKNGSLFDVTMGSYDGAEVCELVGIFLLSKLKDRFSDVQLGLYRDDGLGLTKAISGSELERLKKDIILLFQENGLKITIDTNLIQVNFLDVTLNLESGKYWPYRKEDDLPLYIHKESNHSPSIVKQLPKMIESRISALSCNEDVFNKAKDTYTASLRSSGFIYDIKFSKRADTTRNRRSRKRNIVWFNPPYNSAVKTNIGRKFLSLLDKHFPRHHKFSKLFNRNTVKVSYSASPNMSSIIARHNKRILSNKPDDAPRASCQPPIQVSRHAASNGPCIVSSSAPCQERSQTLVRDARHTSSQISGPVTRQRSRRALVQASDQVQGSAPSPAPSQALSQLPGPAMHRTSSQVPTHAPGQVPHPTTAQALNRPADPSSSRTPLCNCRRHESCPLDGRCQEKALIYKATVISASGVMAYIGSTALSFKERYTSHKSSFTHRHLASSTSLSGYVWELKDQGLLPEIKWEILKRSSPYTCGMRKCDLCLTEKLMILRADSAHVLNRHSELMQKCRHKNKFKLIKVK